MLITKPSGGVGPLAACHRRQRIVQQQHHEPRQPGTVANGQMHVVMLPQLRVVSSLTTLPEALADEL